MPLPRIAVIGLGNLIMGDDGLGPRVIHELQKESVPENVELLDLGTPGLGLSTYITGFDSLILVDAVHDQAEPGSVRVFTKDELLALPSQPRMSPHAPAVKEALALAELSGDAPRDVILIGVVPEDCSMGIRLTPAVEASVPVVLVEVRRALAKQGAAAP